MDLPPDNLYGMTPAAAREYLAAHAATRLLNEKKLAELETAVKKWTDRAALARSKGVADLAEAADAEAARAAAERDKLAAETRDLADQIERMRRQLPGLAARERGVDPDLLEQELLIAAGRNPGDEAAAAAERQLGDLEKHAAADAELAALKARLGGKDAQSE
jgi:phage shock protein A